MTAVRRPWIMGVARPTTRFTRRAGAWTLQATRYAAASTALAAKRASDASRLVTDALARASKRAGRDVAHEARDFRNTLLPGAPAVARRVPEESPRSVATLLFVAGIAIGLVYGFTDSWPQALTTAACLLTLGMTFALHQAQRRDALSLQRSLDELRQSLRVTQALLQVDELEDAEELRASGMFAPAAEDDATRRISVLVP